MRPEELAREVAKRPFYGLRMHLSDGTVYEVRHPELVMVMLGVAQVYKPAPGQHVAPVYSTYDVINLDQITRVETLMPTQVNN
jgi:hypothetical protein